MGGLESMNSVNNAVNYTSSLLNGTYLNMKAKSDALDQSIQNKIDSVAAWGTAPAFAGGKKKSKKSSRKRVSRKRDSKKRVSRKRVTRGGGGSDWLNTVNSRGNVNGPDDHWGVSSAMWNSQFEKSGENIPMSELRKGGYALQSQPKIEIPTGFDSNAQSHEVIQSELGNLGTQRI